MNPFCVAPTAVDRYHEQGALVAVLLGLDVTLICTTL